ncbi:SRPBCC family protein [Pseudoduganella sp. SL102]|uniref:SRPBCC family protein n=1 Tax=Pseudoduganella sp. SL102 TaxID=2995154 RepID=UPI00248CE9CF|nr:SRPBCC family protein [Pseudoduganella sp. SL102]WBS03001.1 SRPBCC family protein [Pseudoduganella sp. SL102]
MDECNMDGERSMDDGSMDDCNIVTTRVLDAPRGRVFAAFSDPEQLAQWWGPEGFTSTFQGFDFTAGGAWTFVMHGPDGTTYPNESHFVEIVPGERIVFDHVSGHAFRATFEFTDADGKTRLRWTMHFGDPAECAKVARFVAGANEQNLDRLAALLRHAP